MKITYLGHSGFLAETSTAFYLFDYIRGTLPELDKSKPLYVLSSHFHEDHFSPLIFSPEIREKTCRYLLSYDIRKKYQRKNPAWLNENQSKIQWIERDSSFSSNDFRGKALCSTDIGTAFVIRDADGTNLYHAGDLNWWHWDGEPSSWNNNMAANYKKEIQKIRGISFDVAFLPLDPRQEAAYCYGINYFLENVSAKHIFPMHFWKDYGVISRYLSEYPLEEASNTIIHLIQKEGETYEI